ncbi:MAG: hypothetical protein WDA22_17655 [Bacteroidota bacterium]
MKTKIISLIPFVLILMLNSCDNINQSADNDNRILLLDGYIKPATKVVYGRIEVSTLKTVNGKAVEVVWDQCQIDSLGHFKLVVLPLPDDCLKPVNLLYQSSNGSINISDTSAQIGRITFFPIYCKDSTFYSAEVWSDSVVMTKHISFIYSTKDVNILGRDSVKDASSDIYISEYNVMMKKGWNKVVHQYLAYPASTGTHYLVYVDNQINGYWLVPNY